MKKDKTTTKKREGKTSGPKYCPTSQQNKELIQSAKGFNQYTLTEVNHSLEGDLKDNNLKIDTGPSSELLETNQKEHQSSAVSKDSSSENESEEDVKVQNLETNTNPTSELPKSIAEKLRPRGNVEGKGMV